MAQLVYDCTLNQIWLAVVTSRRARAGWYVAKTYATYLAARDCYQSIEDAILRKLDCVSMNLADNRAAFGSQRHMGHETSGRAERLEFGIGSVEDAVAHADDNRICHHFILDHLD